MQRKVVRQLNKSRAPNDLTTTVDMLTSQPFEAESLEVFIKYPVSILSILNFINS
jgi:hypothetical protein